MRLPRKVSRSSVLFPAGIFAFSHPSCDVGCLFTPRYKQGAIKSTAADGPRHSGQMSSRQEVTAIVSRPFEKIAPRNEVLSCI